MKWHRITQALTLLLLSSVTVSQAAETKLLSYNVWFDDDSGLQHRYQNINTFIDSEQPDYVCLQEVTPAYRQMLSTVFSANYHIYAETTPAKNYGNVILTRVEAVNHKTLALNSRMSRSALIVEGTDYMVMNLHLESMLEDTVIREKQILQVLDQTKDSKALILCGDFNFGDGEQENRMLTGFVDAGKKQPVATFDITNNKLASQNRFYNEPSRRLDKILVKADGVATQIKVPTLDYSDHYPLLVTITDAVTGSKAQQQ